MDLPFRLNKYLHQDLVIQILNTIFSLVDFNQTILYMCKVSNKAFLTDFFQNIFVKHITLRRIKPKFTSFVGNILAFIYDRMQLRIFE